MGMVRLRFLAGFLLMICGLVLILLPHHVYSLILEVSVLYCLLHAGYLLYCFLKEKKWMDILSACLTFGFMLVLMEHTYFPEWIIRVSFGGYCLLCSAATFVQFVINLKNRIKGNIFIGTYVISYLILGCFLLFTPDFNTDLLMRFFGLYFILLGIRYFHDLYEEFNLDTKYRWKRKIRIMLPPFLCAFLPDWALNKINRLLQAGKEADVKSIKKVNRETTLKVMVHVGPEGFQKVGHISFAYKGIVYSYGNYDAKSFRWNQTLGDGVYFNVLLKDYIPNMMYAENNSIFEYGIQTTPEQNEKIEEELRLLRKNSYRWLCPIEEAQGYDRFSTFQSNYPSRLHYRTGAKFYKIKTGKFKTYWALGDNCATFTDIILGALGCDVLSIRGIISPGTYFDFLEKEYLKPYSPIVSRVVHIKK